MILRHPLDRIGKGWRLLNSPLNLWRIGYKSGPDHSNEWQKEVSKPATMPQTVRSITVSEKVDSSIIKTPGHHYERKIVSRSAFIVGRTFGRIK